jgi:uncharacterized membrane protein
LRLIGGLTAGLAGVAFLVPPEAFTAGSGQLWGASAILVGAMSWALGVRYSATALLPGDPFVRASTTLLCGAALLLTTSAVTGEVAGLDLRAISGRSLLGLAYLVICGSVVAFSAYTWLLERCSATLVATHSYVNPLIAVALGWLFAGEPMTVRIALATGLIVSAVLLLRAEWTRENAGAGEPVCGRPRRCRTGTQASMAALATWFPSTVESRGGVRFRIRPCLPAPGRRGSQLESPSRSETRSQTESWSRSDQS